jgi:RimJ/RimL family protein N-acetyltransferase
MGVELVRLSGYRLQNEPSDVAAYKWAALRQEVKKYLPLMQNMVPGFYFDDASAKWTLEDHIISKLQNGEVYFSFSGKQRTLENFIGLAAITDIEFGRSGYLEGIANAQYYTPLGIGKSMGEIIAYAFGDFGNAGLGLKKLKAKVVQGNMRTIRMLAKAGFEPYGISKMDGLRGGVPCDILLLETFNPKYFSTGTQVITNAISPQSTQLPADELPGGTASVDLRGGTASTIHAEPEWSEGGEPSPAGNGTGAELVEPEQLRRDREPIFTEREGWTLRPESDTADEQLLHAESGAASSSGGAVGGSGFGAKLRQLWGG